MSTEKPNMGYWQKVSSQGEKEGKPMTAKKLKNLLNLSIKMWLSKTGKSKIPLSKFKSAILTQYDSTILNKYSITLYKNGKTVKVNHKLNKVQLSDMAKIAFTKPFSFPSTKKDLKPSKEMKKIILASKMEALVSFHMLRKHTKAFPTCLACKAVKAFLEWEFHYSPPLKDKTLNVPKVETFIAEKTPSGEVKFIQMDKVVDEELELPDSLTLIDKLNETVMKYTIKPYLGIWAAGEDKTGGFTDGFDG